VCKYACSEEVPEPVDLEGDGFSVAFDPLDGSSIVDTNFTVRLAVYPSSSGPPACTCLCLMSCG
jgi:fructose-1,6-bisphosphatase